MRLKIVRGLVHVLNRDDSVEFAFVSHPSTNGREELMWANDFEASVATK